MDTNYFLQHLPRTIFSGASGNIFHIQPVMIWWVGGSGISLSNELGFQWIENQVFCMETSPALLTAGST